MNDNSKKLYRWCNESTTESGNKYYDWQLNDLNGKFVANVYSTNYDDHWVVNIKDMDTEEYKFDTMKLAKLFVETKLAEQGYIFTTEKYL